MTQIKQYRLTHYWLLKLGNNWSSSSEPMLICLLESLLICWKYLPMSLFISQFRPTLFLVKEKKRSFTLKTQWAIEEKVDKLLKAGFIKEIHYPYWTANMVTVNKVNDKWRICIDYIDLNKFYPKDSYHLPRIDQLLDATSKHELLNFRMLSLDIIKSGW